MKLTIHEIIEDISAMDEELRKYEQKYGLASPVFYDLFSQGLLDDGEFAQTADFCMWAGAYEIRLDRERRFLDLSRQYASALRPHYEGEGLELVPLREMADA